ncbi:MAG: hypothetical protein ACLR8P_14255, partial [Clostridium fessum]
RLREDKGFNASAPGGASLGDHPDGDGWENAETSGDAQSSGETLRVLESGDAGKLLCCREYFVGGGKAPERGKVIASVSRQMDEGRS